MVGYAFGPAVGDRTADTWGLGNLVAGLLCVALILVPPVAHRWLRLGAIPAFWIAYVLTRPLGASFADWMSYRGLGLGAALTAGVWAPAFRRGLVFPGATPDEAPRPPPRPPPPLSRRRRGHHHHEHVHGHLDRPGRLRHAGRGPGDERPRRAAGPPGRRRGRRAVRGRLDRPAQRHALPVAGRQRPVLPRRDLRRGPCELRRADRRARGGRGRPAARPDPLRPPQRPSRDRRRACGCAPPAARGTRGD